MRAGGDSRRFRSENKTCGILQRTAPINMHVYDRERRAVDLVRPVDSPCLNDRVDAAIADTCQDSRNDLKDPVSLH